MPCFAISDRTIPTGTLDYPPIQKTSDTITRESATHVQSECPAAHTATDMRVNYGEIMKATPDE